MTLIRPDGMSATSQPCTVRLHSVDVALPSDSAADILKRCFKEVRVQHPLTGEVMTQMAAAMQPDTALVLLEAVNAVKHLQEQIDEIKQALSGSYINGVALAASEMRNDQKACGVGDPVSQC